MKKLIIKAIIWLFNRYAFDSWVEQQEQESRLEFQRKHNLQDDEVEEALIDAQQEKYRDVYYQGKADGYKQALEENF